MILRSNVGRLFFRQIRASAANTRACTLQESIPKYILQRNRFTTNNCVRNVRDPASTGKVGERPGRAEQAEPQSQPPPQPDENLTFNDVLQSEKPVLLYLAPPQGGLVMVGWIFAASMLTTGIYTVYYSQLEAINKILSSFYRIGLSVSAVLFCYMGYWWGILGTSNMIKSIHTVRKGVQRALCLRVQIQTRPYPWRKPTTEYFNIGDNFIAAGDIENASKQITPWMLRGNFGRYATAFPLHIRMILFEYGMARLMSYGKPDVLVGKIDARGWFLQGGSGKHI
jgi:hypothetical protein